MKIKRFPPSVLATSAAFGLAVLMSPYAAPAAELDDLQRQVDALQSELSQVKAQQSQMQTAQQMAAEAKDEGKGMTVKYKTGVQIESADKAFTAHIGGRLMVDSAWYDEDKSKLGDGTELRRMRVFVEGTMYEDWQYKNQIDFADDKVSIKDAYIKYKGLKPATLTVGNFKVPVSLENLTSSRFITFIERALPNVLVEPDRRIGVGANVHGDVWTAALGLYGDEVSADPGDEENEGWAVAGRGTVALGCPATCLHLGIGGRVTGPDGENSVRFRQRPESHVTDARFVDTGTLHDVDNFYDVIPEAAFVYGPFALQGEYMHTWVNRERLDDLEFDGWYVEGSYFLTGESRNYEPKKGAFDRVKPKHNLGDGGFGALQVAVRYSTIDLTDGAVLGGEEDNVTLGLNWHVNPNVRFMFNAIWVNNDEDATGNASHLLPGELSAGDDDPFIAQIRAQIDF